MVNMILNYVPILYISVCILQMFGTHTDRIKKVFAAFQFWKYA